jgi:hypothetical protein
MLPVEVYKWIAYPFHQFRLLVSQRNQKSKLIERTRQFTLYTSTPPLTCDGRRESQHVDTKGATTIFTINCENQDSNSRPWALIPCQASCTSQYNQKSELMERTSTIHLYTSTLPNYHREMGRFPHGRMGYPIDPKIPCRDTVPWVFLPWQPYKPQDGHAYGRMQSFESTAAYMVCTLQAKIPSWIHQEQTSWGRRDKGTKRARDQFGVFRSPVA